MSNKTKEIRKKQLESEINKMRSLEKKIEGKSLNFYTYEKSANGVGGNVIQQAYTIRHACEERQRIIVKLYKNTIEYLQFVHDTFDKVDSDLAMINRE